MQKKKERKENENREGIHILWGQHSSDIKTCYNIPRKKVIDQYRILKFSIGKLNLGWIKIDKAL